MGHLVWSALEAAQVLHEEGLSVRVLNMHTVKPLDEAAIVAAARETGAIVTAEEHMLNGGLGEAVARVVSTQKPVPIEYVGVNDQVGQSGLPMQLMEEYHLSTTDIIAACRVALRRKLE